MPRGSCRIFSTPPSSSKWRSTKAARVRSIPMSRIRPGERRWRRSRYWPTTRWPCFRSWPTSRSVTRRSSATDSAAKRRAGNSGPHRETAGNTGYRRHALDPGSDKVAVDRLDRALRDRLGSATRGIGAAADVPALDDEPHRRRPAADARALSPSLRRPGGALCSLAAAPMAWLVSRTDLPGKRLLRTLILASFVTPPFLGAFAWVLLGGPNAGLINQWYYALFGLKPFEATPLINIFSAGGMVFVMALYTFPYVFTFVANSLDVIPSELEEASAILGAPAWRTALH